MTPLLKTCPDVRPRTLSAGILLKVSEALVEKGAILGRDRDIRFRKRIPQRFDQLKAIAGAQLQRLCEQVGVHGGKYSAMQSRGFLSSTGTIMGRRGKRRGDRPRRANASQRSGPLRSSTPQRMPHSDYSTIRSARSSNDGGMVSPSAFAVLRLMTNWNFVGCSTGSSAGFAPLRSLST